MNAVKPFNVPREWTRTTSGREIVMLVVSVLRIDPRVEREARALAANGWIVRIVGPDLSEPRLMEQPISWGLNVTFHLLPAEAAQYSHTEPWLAGETLYEAAIKFAPFAYHCHDLNTALVGLRAASTVGARCICDFHEWTSENVTWNSELYRWEAHVYSFAGRSGARCGSPTRSSPSTRRLRANWMSLAARLVGALRW
jgi:hypothetical protein